MEIQKNLHLKKAPVLYYISKTDVLFIQIYSGGGLLFSVIMGA